MTGTDRLSRLSAIKLALLARQLRQEGAELELLRAEPMAVVGLGCRFPGGESPDEFWQLLHDGVDAITEVPPDRWDWRQYYDPDPAAPGKMTTRWGGFLRQVDGFDAAFFGISPREAVHLDPQQRLFLEVAYEALDDAGLTRQSLAGERVGVFASAFHNDYGQAQYAALEGVDAYTGTGTQHSILVNRLSYLLDLRGPSVAVNTACSSSLIAVHLACESLRSGESNVAIAGAVSLVLAPDVTVALSKWGFMAEDGRCKTFDARANGFVRGEGCGVIVLKRMGDALADGDVILGVIRGSAVNQDGRTNVLTAPSGLAQQAVVRAALEAGAISADQISYFEAHGTGTVLGDPIEVEALAEVLGSRLPGHPVVLGAVKTNIGHLEGAAGIAGLIKVLLAFRHEEIPPNLHFASLNPNIDLGQGLFEIPTTLRPWPRGAAPRLAGVSSFGFGGTNAHAVLEEPPLPSPGSATERVTDDTHLLAISAQTDTALRALAALYRDRMLEPATSAADVCFSAALHRDHLDHRAAIAGLNAAALAEGLDAVVRGETPLSGAQGRRVAGERPQVAFIFSGQGPQWWGMGRELRATEGVFADALAACDAALGPHLDWSLIAEFERPESDSRLGETEIAQPAIFAIQVAIAALWRSWGVEPDAVLGHSVGEIAAAHVAGALSLADAARLVAVRGRIMQEATGLGRMAAVDLSEAEATTLARASGGRLSVAAVNAPRSSVLSGDEAALAAALEHLTSRHIAHKLLPVNYAFHSAQMDPFEPRLVGALNGLAAGRLSVPMVSSVTGSAIEGPALDARYWGRNLRNTVRFGPAVEALLTLGIDSFVEVAPHPVLGLSVESVCEQRVARATTVASLRRGRPESLTMRSAAATLYAGGASLRWEGFFPRGGTRVALPSYPWQRTRYWQSSPVPVRPRDGGHPLLGRRVESPALIGPLFESRISADSPAFLRDHRVGGRVAAPATAFIELALAAAGAMSGAPCTTVRDLFLREPLLLPDEQERVLQCVTHPAMGGFAFEIFSVAAGEEAVRSRWTLHATGSADQEPCAIPAVTDLSAVRERCSEVLDPEEMYASHDKRGVQFGRSFRGLRQIRRGGSEAVGQIVAPDDLAALGAFAFHPALLDACLQVVAALLPVEHEAPPLYLPLGSDAITIFARPVGPLWSHATLRPVADAATLVVDIIVTDDRGAPIVRVGGLRLARVATERFGQRGDQAAECLYQTEWRPSPAPASAQPSGTWLILSDASGVGADLAKRLTAAGAKAIVATAGERFSRHEGGWTLRAESPEEFYLLLREATPGEGLAGVVHLWNLDLEVKADAEVAALERAALFGTGSVLHLAQALLHTGGASPGVWIVSRGARTAVRSQPLVNSIQALPWGFARSLEAEHPDLRLIRVDLDLADGAGADAVLRELGVDGSTEREVAWRGGTRYAPRLVRVAHRANASPAPTSAGVRLVASASGLIEDLALRPLEPAPLGDSDIEIDVEVTGLNFRDVLNALGMAPGAPMQLGGECSGVVRRVGADVGAFVAGDRVMAFAMGSFASRVVVDARRAARLPAGMSATQAAATPVAFLTAAYALNRLAQVRRGERVLVHAGAGGVGMAAIQLALQVGAEVFATAGSPEKRALLASIGVSHVMDSRSLAFADDVHQRTNGKGVHVVLNSLAGEFIPASFDILARGGRFLEMGKRGIWTAEDAALRRPDATYFSFDLGEIAAANPAVIQELFAELAQGFEAGVLRPLPVAAWPLAEAASAFRTMAQALHTGKLVVVHPAAKTPAPVPRTDGTYLITGGLGTLGLSTARWLLARGATDVVLVGRSAPDENARLTIDALRVAGANVQVESVDITNDVAVGELVRSLARGESPLKGIVHAAGILDDGVVLEQTWPRAARVLAPKLRGAVLLARHARGLDLNLFVCYSSVTGVFGSPGQSSYAAANAYLDAFCHELRGSGIPAVSVQWGPWRDGGMAAERSAPHAARWNERGVRPMADDLALAALELALASGIPEVAVLSVDWRRFGAQLGAAPSRALLNELLDGHAPATTSAASVLPQLMAAPASRRRALLITHGRTLALRILALDEATPVDERRPLKELGLDSLMAVELRNAFARSLECSLPATLAFDHPTLSALAEYLQDRLFGADTRPPASIVASDAGEIGALSEEAAEELLLAELDSGNGDP